MIFDFPPIRARTVTLEDGTHKSVLRWKRWLRIIWNKSQRTIIIGSWKIDISREIK